MGSRFRCLDAGVPRTESIRAVVVGPYDEDPTTLPEYQPTEPQFIEPLDTDEYEKETKELLSQVPSQHHEYLDIFRKKGGTPEKPSTDIRKRRRTPTRRT